MSAATTIFCILLLLMMMMLADVTMTQPARCNKTKSLCMMNDFTYTQHYGLAIDVYHEHQQCVLVLDTLRDW